MYSLKYECVCRHFVSFVKYVPDRPMCLDIVSEL